VWNPQRPVARRLSHTLTIVAQCGGRPIDTATSGRKAQPIEGENRSSVQQVVAVQKCQGGTYVPHRFYLFPL